MGNFKELKVWTRSKELAIRIYRLTNQSLFAKDFGLRDQIRRAAVSVPSNIAEGDELKTQKQGLNHLYIAKGSLAELRTQLEIALGIEYITEEIFTTIDSECDEIGKMIASLINHRNKNLDS